MKRLLFTILLCLSVYGLIAFLTWDITLGCLDKSIKYRIEFLLILLINSWIYYPNEKKK